MSFLRVHGLSGQGIGKLVEHRWWGLVTVVLLGGFRVLFFYLVARCGRGRIRLLGFLLWLFFALFLSVVGVRSSRSAATHQLLIKINLNYRGYKAPILL